MMHITSYKSQELMRASVYHHILITFSGGLLISSSSVLSRLEFFDDKVTVENFLTLTLETDATLDERFTGLLGSLFKVT